MFLIPFDLAPLRKKFRAALLCEYVVFSGMALRQEWAV